MTEPLVIFDIGAVLLELTYGRFYDFVARSHNPVPDFKNEYAKLELCDLRGELTYDEALQTAKPLINTKRTITDEETIKAISHCWGKQIGEMVDLKWRLASNGVPVGLLSNMPTIGYQVLSNKYPDIFETYSDVSPKIYSCDVKAIKPEEKIYKAVPSHFSPVIFIDDKESYLTAAEPLGWKGIHYTPFIDPDEAVRSFKAHNAALSSNTLVARNLEETVVALRKFGINI